MKNPSQEPLTKSHIQQALDVFWETESEESVSALLQRLKDYLWQDGTFLFAAKLPPEASAWLSRQPEEREGDLTLEMQWLLREDVPYFAAFTSQEEMEKGERTSLVTLSLYDVAEAVLAGDVMGGIVLNAWEHPLFLDRMLLRELLELQEPPEECASDHLS